MGRPPVVRTVVKDVVRIQQCDDDVYVQQGAHELYAFLIPNLLHTFQRDDLAARRQQRDAAAQS